MNENKRIKICSFVLLGVGLLSALACFAFPERQRLFIVVSGLALMISALFGLIFSKTVQRHCTLKTTAVSLGLSLTGAAGLGCLFIWYTIEVFHEASKHPISYPASIIGMIVSFVIFVALIVLYIFLRARKGIFSVKGLLIDIGTSVLFLPFFFIWCSLVYELLSKLTYYIFQYSM